MRTKNFLIMLSFCLGVCFTSVGQASLEPGQGTEGNLKSPENYKCSNGKWKTKCVDHPFLGCSPPPKC